MLLRKSVYIFYILIIVSGGIAATYINKLGTSAMQASLPLFQNKLPLLERISTIQLSFTEIEVILYEYYATTERNIFTNRFKDNLTTIETELSLLKSELDNDNNNLIKAESLLKKVIALSADLDKTLSAQSIDWDRARELLVEIRALSHNVTKLLADTSHVIHRDLYSGGKFIEDQLHTIMATVLIISSIIFLISIVAVYYFNLFIKEISERKRLSMFAERNPLAIIQLSTSGEIMYSNPSSLELLEKLESPENNTALLLPDMIQTKIHELRISESKDAYWEYTIGKLILGCNAHYLTDLSICHLYIADITKKKESESELKSSEERYRTFYDDNPSIFYTLSPKGQILSINHFGANHLGYEKEELLGKSFFNQIPNNDRAAVYKALSSVAKEIGQTSKYKVRRFCKDEHTIWVRETCRSAIDKDGNNIILVVSEDVSKEHELSIKLSYQATHDRLTGLYNRHEFEQRLITLLEKAKVDKTEHTLCYIDLDQFKIINDTCGHVAGDKLLQSLGNKLNQHMPSHVTISRLGGDEFGILFENSSQAEAWKYSRKLLQKIRDFEFYWKEKKYTIGASIGLVAFDETSSNANELLSLADAACYSAKEQGRNRIHVYSLDDDDIEHRHAEMKIVQQVKLALEEDRFSLYFQTLAPVSTENNGACYELLIRMLDEQNNIVPPNNFLPAVEQYGLSTKLDFWVIDTAFTWLTEHPEALEELQHCGINLSGQTLADDSLLAFLVNKFNQTNIPPHKICFEVTETAAIANFDKAINLINNMKERGCRFALDDFGSGLSSFAYLKDIPIDYLKIDGVFVKDIVNNPIDHAMVKSINEVGHVMGIKTIAEYVENDEITAVLREIGVDYLQGYGIAMPKPLSEYPLSNDKPQNLLHLNDFKLKKKLTG